tara:strand:- start:8247 stop:8687 length:441 start_codon:yes stop_codon:yes gene_type:complete
MVKNKKVYFVSSTELKNDWSKMLFNVNNNWNNHNLTSKVYLNIDSLSNLYEDESLYLENGVLSFNDKVIQVLDKNYINEINPNYLVVNKKSLKLLKPYLKQSKPKYIIFDSTIPSYKLKYYKENIDSNFTTIISLDKKYYSVDLNE